ncbi:hypothetical protein R3P38DRAFT_2831330 [Favolaschia claudopus]|uniref:Uncharacterized protein n=1 Tax=Favolaschia claudopus TaxID=2862362 RepID=A0AAW0EBW0_9AGAR
MSHLTASPFHKPSPFEFPQRTVSSETIPNHHGHAQLPTPAPTSIVGAHDPHATEYFDTPTASISAAEAPGSRFRKAASSIVYHHSGLRESRERTVQRNSRSFVVVLPPTSLPQDHGHLGHTLSSGPRNRLAQGLLMPLFPTMYGQLTAIAREYNFPSTTGLCLYLHYTDQGITVTPRISDDSWQMIWSHVLDAHPGTAHTGLPISGKIEFDIDMRLARWYGAWMASSHREHVDVPMSVTPSAAPSVIHYREDSRSTFADGDDQDNHSVARPAPRHVPRKLSLIDRFDTMSARSVPRSIVARPSRPSPPDIHPGHNLPPIFQEDEPKTAKLDLEHRVNTWRASASIAPGTLVAEAAQIVLAEVNMDSPPLDESPAMLTQEDEQPDDEYRIEDYAFSISSVGPNTDYDPYSPLTWYYDPSVHLAHRAQGSVCLTPTTCTSFGPSDYTLPEELLMPGEDSDYIRTPDIARRMFEDAPPSPSVATSWGAPESFPPSPTSEYHAPSVHLGDRQEFSRPVTPMTATSWGAPESFPPSPTTPFYVQTPDAGQRSFDLSDPTPRPWNQVWPYNADRRVAEIESEASNPVYDDVFEEEADGPWNMVWPYHAATDAAPQESAPAPHQNHSAPAPRVRAAEVVLAAGVAAAAGITITLAATTPTIERQDRAEPWNMIWPYQEAAAGQVSVRLPTVYPCLNIYPAVYPHFDLYPAASGAFTDVTPKTERGPITIIPSGYPHFHLYPVYPANLLDLYPPTVVRERASFGISTRLAPSYGHFDLYSAVYPHVVPYPPFQGEMEASSQVSSSVCYPHFNLYPPVATSSKTPARISVSERQPISVVLRTAYPVFNLCTFLTAIPSFPSSFSVDPPVYPVFDIYPGMQADSMDRSVTIRLATAYPIFDLYPAVYPAFDLYPALPEDTRKVKVHVSGHQLSAGYPDFNIYPAVSQAPRTPKIRVAAAAVALEKVVLSIGYPDFNIYPPVSSSRQTVRAKSSPIPSGPISVRVPVAYPIFNIYPPVYPVLEIYPHRPDDCPPARYGPAVVRSFVCYPTFVLYPSVIPAVYPVFEIYYPALPDDVIARASRQRSEISVRVTPVYPIFDLYPAVYPALEIYPALPELRPAQRQVAQGISIRMALYPVFDLYPGQYGPSLPEDCVAETSGYPHFNLYPAARRNANVRRSMQSTPAVNYPNFNLYPAVYPYFDLYPEVVKRVELGGLHVGAVARYPYFNLYPAVYPYFDLYPEAVKRIEVRGLHIGAVSRYPYFNLYPAVYPHFDLFPALLSMQESRNRKISRFTRSDLHALVAKAGMSPQSKVRKPSRTHRDLHLALFPRGVAVVTPSGSPPRKTHHDLHLEVFSRGFETSTPSGTPTLKATSTTEAPPSTPPTTVAARRRSGSVLRQSLPPSPRPVGARSPLPRTPPAEPTISIPTVSVDPPRRALSTVSRSSTTHIATKTASLTRSVSMASRPATSPSDSPKLERTASVGGPRKRDSLVLQRVRALQMSSEPSIKEDDPLANFPLPPRGTVHPPRKVVS